MNYVKSIYMDSTTTYPTGKVFDRVVVLQDAEFSTFSADWKVGDTTTDVTATEIDSLSAGMVVPATIKNMVVTSGKVLLCKDA